MPERITHSLRTQTPDFECSPGSPRPLCGFLLAIGLAIGFPSQGLSQSYEDGYGAVEITDSDRSTRSTSRSAETTISQRGRSRIRPGDRVGRRYSQAPDETETADNDTGQDAARKYMRPKRGASDSDSDRSAGQTSSGDHYLAIHGGVFVSDTAYKWSRPDQQDNIGTWNFGVTYRVGEWVNSMDLNLRVDLARIAPSAGPTTKLSFLPVVTFPDAGSRFPLYFGIGAGLGIFTNQIDGESSLTLDYQLLAGARFFNLWGQTGLFVEGGLKNSLFLLSDGQFNATFVAGGLVFTF